jgi:hypothetical protein
MSKRTKNDLQNIAQKTKHQATPQNRGLAPATFQQQLYVGYVFPSSSDIRELVVPIMLSLINNSC